MKTYKVCNRPIDKKDKRHRITCSHSCSSIYSRTTNLWNWQQRTKEERRLYQIKYREEHPNKARDYLREWRLNNPNKVKLYEENRRRKHALDL